MSSGMYGFLHLYFPFLSQLEPPPWTEMTIDSLSPFFRLPPKRSNMSPSDPSTFPMADLRSVCVYSPLTLAVISRALYQIRSSSFCHRRSFPLGYYKHVLVFSPPFPLGRSPLLLPTLLEAHYPQIRRFFESLLTLPSQSIFYAPGRFPSFRSPPAEDLSWV